jgi:hypothetical protein
MSHTKKNSKSEDSICELNLTDSISWSLLQKRIGDNLNTLEETLSSGLSSSDILEPKDIFETFRLKTSNLGHFTTPNILN